MMNEMKLLIMEALDNDKNKKIKKENTINRRVNSVEKDKDEFRASYESTFMFWRNSFVNEGTSRNGSNVSCGSCVENRERQHTI